MEKFRQWGLEPGWLVDPQAKFEPFFFLKNKCFRLFVIDVRR